MNNPSGECVGLVLVWAAVPVCTQDVVLAMGSGVTPGGAQGTIWGVRV